GDTMFSKEFIAKKQQERQAARAQVLEHIELMVKALNHGQHEVLGVWHLDEATQITVEALGDGTLRARKWTKQNDEWTGTVLEQAEPAMEALRSEPEPVEW